MRFHHVKQPLKTGDRRKLGDVAILLFVHSKFHNTALEHVFIT
jgi:hypothetical protein